MHVKLLVIQSTQMWSSNLGDGDTGRNFDVKYKLISNTPNLLFSQEDWIKILFLCQCELEEKKYYLLNLIEDNELTITYDMVTCEYTQKNPISLCRFVPKTDWLTPIYYINPFRTDRIRRILASSKSPQKFLVEDQFLTKFEKFSNSEKAFSEYKFEIDLIKNSNIREFEIPLALHGNNIDIYVCLEKHCEIESNDVHYFLLSNIENDLILFLMKFVIH